MKNFEIFIEKFFSEASYDEVDCIFRFRGWGLTRNNEKIT